MGRPRLLSLKAFETHLQLETSELRRKSHRIYLEWYTRKNRRILDFSEAYAQFGPLGKVQRPCLLAFVFEFRIIYVNYGSLVEQVEDNGYKGNLNF